MLMQLIVLPKRSLWRWSKLTRRQRPYSFNKLRLSIAVLDKGRAAVQAVWKHFRELLPSKNQASPLELHYQNSVLNSPFEISNAFNDHFASIADAIIENSQSHGNDFTKLTDFINSKLPHDVSFDIPDFSVDYVCDSLRKLNVKKGTGLDGLQPKFLVMASDIIAP